MTPTRARAYFCEQVRKYGVVDCYWYRGRLVTRYPLSLRAMGIPPDAVMIGRYSYPCDADDFIEDLDAARSS